MNVAFKFSIADLFPSRSDRNESCLLVDEFSSPILRAAAVPVRRGR